MRKLKYYCIKDLQGNLLTSDLSYNTQDAFKRAVQFCEKSLGVEIKELHVPKLKCMVQIWASMMNNGQPKSETFKRLLSNNDDSQSINIYLELVKCLLGMQNKHTLPALSLGLIESIPLQNPKHYIQLGDKIRNELKIILGEDGIILFPSFPVVAPYHQQPVLTNPLDWIYYGTFNALGFPGKVF